MNASPAKNITTPMWAQIEALVENVHGWTPIDQLYTLYTMTLLTSELEGDIIEVGSWCGRSAVVLAAAVKAASNSLVYCADLFPEKDDWKQNSDGTYSFEVIIDGKHYCGYQEQTVWKETFESQTEKFYESYNGVLDRFREVVTERGMDDVVRAHRGDLASLLDKLGANFRCRLAFLDGDHGFDAVCEDINNIDKHLMPGGWICFDDAFTSYDGVNRAIAKHIIANPRYERCQQMTRKLFVAQKKCDV